MPEGNSKYDKYIGNVKLAADAGISVNDLRAEARQHDLKNGLTNLFIFMAISVAIIVIIALIIRSRNKFDKAD